MKRSKKQDEPKKLGHGYIEGPDAYRVSRVSKARNRYECEGPLRAVRDSDEVSPGTGDAIRTSPAKDCSGFIDKGEIFVHLQPHDIEVYPSYWSAHRMCVECAVKENIVVKDEYQ